MGIANGDYTPTIVTIMGDFMEQSRVACCIVTGMFGVAFLAFCCEQKRYIGQRSLNKFFFFGKIKQFVKIPSYGEPPG